MGTDEHTLNRIIVSRCEIDMVEIKQKFQQLYKKSFAEFLKVDTYTYNYINFIFLLNS